MQEKRPKSKKPNKRRKMTISRLLGQEQVKDIVDELAKEANDIEEVAVVFTKYGEGMFTLLSNMSPARVTWAFEWIKHGLLSGEEGEGIDEG